MINSIIRNSFILLLATCSFIIKLKYVGKNIKQFLQLLIDKKRSGTIHSYSAIKKAIFKYSIPFGYLPIRAGTPLFRGRVNDNIGEFFNKITDLCHQTDISKITKFGRANEPQQSIFYCSTTLETALFEVSNIHRFRLENEYEAITYGQWILQKDILVTGLPLVSKNFNKNPLADELDRSFQNIVNKHRNEDTEDWLSVINFFSEEFSKILMIMKLNILFLAPLPIIFIPSQL